MELKSHEERIEELNHALGCLIIAETSIKKVNRRLDNAKLDKAIKDISKASKNTTLVVNDIREYITKQIAILTK